MSASINDIKRRRCPNWLTSEKILLVDLVQNHFNIIENKKTDGVTVKRKLSEWNIISEEYNSQTTQCHRTADNLKAQWESLKKTARKEESNQRMYTIKTGGGPPYIKKEDLIHQRVLSLIKMTAVGLNNSFDSDSIALPVETEFSEPMCSQDNSIVETEGPLVETEIVFSVLNDVDDVIVNKSIETLKDKDWGDYTPQLLQTPVSAPLKFNKEEKNEDTPKKSYLKGRSWITRRRPVHNSTTLSLEQLHKKKIDGLEVLNIQAAEEREELKAINSVELEIKKEILKQDYK